MAEPMIVVRGEALREVPPEQAVLTVTVSERGRDREAVMARLVELSTELRALVDSFGDAIERRETGSIRVYADLKRSGATYHGSVDTTLTVTDFPALGEMIPRLTAVAQTSISGPWWRLRPGSRAGADVRRDAITDALGRAREYAEAVGARVDRLVEIADESSGGGVGIAMARNLSFKGAEADMALELDPQMQTVQAAVIVRVTITEPDLQV